MNDAFTPYETGLTRLLERLGSDHPHYAEALTFQNRLLENLTQVRDYGDSENLRSERNRIVAQLNRLGLEILGIGFNELCGLKAVKDISQIQRLYFERLERYFEQWSERYTDLRLTTDIRVASYKGYRIRTKAQRGKWWFREALSARDREGRPLRERVVILGDPGSGKTTVCQRVTWELAKEGLKASDGYGNPTIPIYLELGTYRADSSQLQGLAPYQRMLAMLAQEVKRLFAGEAAPIYLDWQQLECYMQSIPFVFFLDGLNEVSTNHRERLITDITSFIDTFGGYGHQFVITTRKFDYEYDLAPFLPTDRFEPLEILELDSTGVSEFVMRDLGEIAKAYHLVENLPGDAQAKANLALDALKKGGAIKGDALLAQIKTLFKKLPVEAREDRQARLTRLTSAQQLLELLSRPDYARVLWLAQNPATLKDVTDVYRYKGAIPRSRVRLFERAIQARLRAQAAKLSDQRARFSEEIKFDAMQSIAFQMLDPDEGLRIKQTHALDIFASVLRKHGHQARDAPRLLHELIFSDGLLVERAFGEYSFVKQPYQEYFVARELRDRWLSILEEGKDPLLDHLLQPFLRNRAYFQVTSGMAGLLTSEQVQGLVLRLRKQGQTRRLAALCMRSAEALPTQIVDEFIVWARQRILRFALFPEGLTNILMTLLIILTLAFFWNVELHSVSTNAASLSGHTLAESGHYFRLAVKLFPSVIAISVWFVLHWASRLVETSGTWARFDRFLLVLVVVPQLLLGLGVVDGSIGTLLQLLLIMAPSALLLRLCYTVAVPVASHANERIEEYVVNCHLIPSLEILRDMGPDATSAIIEIKAELTKNRHMSERIKDVIERTWTLSPRTVLQVIEEADIPVRQAEAVEVLESAIMWVETDSTIRHKSVAALFRIIEQSTSIGISLKVIDALGSLAQEPTMYMYRDKIIARLRQVVSDAKYPLRVRRRAWRALPYLYIQDVAWPRPRLRQRLHIWVLVVILAFTILFVLWIIRPVL